MLEQYNEFVSNLKESMDEFSAAAEAGATGRGSKTKALDARKLSMKISNDLKDFRSLSIKNDKEK